MNSVITGLEAAVVVHLTDADPMPSQIPGVTMRPDTVRVEFHDGRLTSVHVSGSVIGKNGQATQRHIRAWYPDDLYRYAPEQIRDAVSQAHNRLVASAWSTGQDEDAV